MKARTKPKVSVETAAPLIPLRPTLESLRRAAADCRACPLWKTGTQTVFGEGSPDAKVLMVGEVPGNDEDLEGRSFVGPAGKLLDHVLEEVGISRGAVYVTNVVLGLRKFCNIHFLHDAADWKVDWKVRAPFCRSAAPLHRINCFSK